MATAIARDALGNEQTAPFDDPFAARRDAITGYYNTYLGRQPDDAGFNGWVTGGMALPDVENAIKNSPEAQAFASQPAAAPASSGPSATPTAQYLQSLLADPQYANNPQGAISAFNSQTGRTTGNEAVYYDPSQHGGVATIGLPDSYLSQQGGAWGITQRTPETSSAAPAASAPATDPLIAQLLGQITQQNTAAQAADAANKQKSDALYNTLLDQSQQSLAVDRNDPTIRAQADAYNANATRAERNYLADLAEKSGPNANLQGQTRVASEQLGQQTGSFEASLLGNELTARRQSISDALNGMRGLLSTDQQAALQKELSTMDDAIRTQQLAQQGTQFDSSQSQALDLALRQLGLQGSQDQNYWSALYSGLLG
jgi:hypothetical protein